MFIISKSVLFALATVALARQAPQQQPEDSQQPLSLNSDPSVLSLSDDKPLVDTEALQAAIKADNLYSRAQALYEAAKLSEDEYNRPTRVIGSAGHNGSLAYIRDTLSRLDDYYNVTDQAFPCYFGNVYSFLLSIGTTVPESTSAMGLTPATKDNEPVRGNLTLVKNQGCDASDYPDEVRGNIAFIKRGSCSFGAKSTHAGKAGALAAVVYNDESGILRGTLGEPVPEQVATFGLSDEDAAPVLDQLQAGYTVDSIAYLDAEVKTIVTTNLIAQTVGGDPDNCVMLGGHSDGVDEGPGINDDGSGSLSVLEVAVQLAQFRVRNCVRFAWWSGEEEGLLGSDYYVSQLSDDEKEKIRLFMDYDMLASPNFVYSIYNATDDENPKGSEALRDLFSAWYADHDLNYTFSPFDGRSDYEGFIRGGIPAGGITTGADGVKTPEEVLKFGGTAGELYDPCYHQLCDDLGNLNMTAWEVSTKLVAHSVATYALSFDGLPKREAVSAAVVDAYDLRVKYHGSKLFI